jgi:hypothetical protein
VLPAVSYRDVRVTEKQTLAQAGLRPLNGAYFLNFCFGATFGGRDEERLAAQMVASGPEPSGGNLGEGFIAEYGPTHSDATASNWRQG